VATPHLPVDGAPGAKALCQLIAELIGGQVIAGYVLWCDTPAALAVGGVLRPRAVVYDCVDELAARAGAAPALREQERVLLGCADLVTTAGHALYEAKRRLHRNVHLMLNSVDRGAFLRAVPVSEPADQAELPHPRIGFTGPIDERVDLDLVAAVAAARPDWQLVMLGPIEVDPAELPQRPNLHWLGAREPDAIPGYLTGWDAALLPYRCDPSTRLLNPIQSLEYLAAGLPVVATSLRDVAQRFGERGVINMADGAAETVVTLAAVLRGDPEPQRRQAELVLAGTSWDRSFGRIKLLVDEVVEARERLGDDEELDQELVHLAAL
jgi:UDP-galactopyranose mutase